MSINIKAALTAYLRGHSSLNDLLVAVATNGEVRSLSKSLAYVRLHLRTTAANLKRLEERNDNDWKEAYRKHVKAEQMRQLANSHAHAARLGKLAALDTVLTTGLWDKTDFTPEVLQNLTNLCVVIREGMSQELRSPNVSSFSDYKESVLSVAAADLGEAETWLDDEEKSVQTYKRLTEALKSAEVLTSPNKTAKSGKSKTRGSRKKAR